MRLPSLPLCVERSRLFVIAAQNTEKDLSRNDVRVTLYNIKSSVWTVFIGAVSYQVLNKENSTLSNVNMLDYLS